MEAKQVPLIELLEKVPANARLEIHDPDGMGTKFIPVGKMCHEAITALRAAIEQAEKQEPHSLLCVCGAEWDIYPDGKEVLASTAPRQWQGLTEAEKVNVALDCGCADVAWMDFADALETKLKEKNNG